MKSKKKFKNSSKRYPFNRSYVLLLMIALIMVSCQEEVVSPQNEIAIEGSTDAVPSQHFNWDTSDYVPTPPGYTPIRVPWFIGAPGSITTTFNSDVYSDHKASDGWEMLYSTFSSTT